MELSLDRWKHKHTRTHLRDELDQFLSFTTLDNVHNPREWWTHNRADYPQLSVMALDILAIPAMSSEIEKVFSSSGLLLTDRRNHLKEDIIEGSECMKSWSANGPAGICTFQDISEVEQMLRALQSKDSGDEG